MDVLNKNPYKHHGFPVLPMFDQAKLQRTGGQPGGQQTATAPGRAGGFCCAMVSTFNQRILMNFLCPILQKPDQGGMVRTKLGFSAADEFVPTVNPKGGIR